MTWRKWWKVNVLLASVFLGCARLFVLEGDKVNLTQTDRIAVLAVRGKNFGADEVTTLKMIVEGVLVAKGYNVVHTDVGDFITDADAKLLFPEGFYSFIKGLSKGVEKGAGLEINKDVLEKLDSGNEVTNAYRRMTVWRKLEDEFYKGLKVTHILFINMKNMHSYEVAIIDLTTKTTSLIFNIYANDRGWKKYFKATVPERIVPIEVSSITRKEQYYYWAQLAVEILDLIEK